MPSALHVFASVLGRGATLSLHQYDSPGPQADMCCLSASHVQQALWKAPQLIVICNVVLCLNSHTPLYELCASTETCLCPSQRTQTEKQRYERARVEISFSG